MRYIIFFSKQTRHRTDMLKRASRDKSDISYYTWLIDSNCILTCQVLFHTLRLKNRVHIYIWGVLISLDFFFFFGNRSHQVRIVFKPIYSTNKWNPVRYLGPIISQINLFKNVWYLEGPCSKMLLKMWLHVRVDLGVMALKEVLYTPQIFRQHIIRLIDRLNISR